MTAHRLARRASVLAAVLAVAGMGGLAVAQSHAPASNQVATMRAPAWQELTPSQREALQPLASQWSTLPANSREKWIQVAARYPKLSPAEQQRVRERMTQWASLQASERGEARLRFQQTRQLSPTELQQKWEAYRALPAEDRDQLGRQARERSGAVTPPTAPGPAALLGSRRVTTEDGRKLNTVPAAGQRNPATPTVVAPALIKDGPGATTRLVTQPPAPPLHQQAGLPKITATRVFVDPVTLLPRKGAQSAAMTAPATSVAVHDDLPD